MYGCPTRSRRWSIVFATKAFPWWRTTPSSPMPPSNPPHPPTTASRDTSSEVSPATSSASASSVAALPCARKCSTAHFPFHPTIGFALTTTGSSFVLPHSDAPRCSTNPLSTIAAMPATHHKAVTTNTNPGHSASATASTSSGISFGASSPNLPPSDNGSG